MNPSKYMRAKDISRDFAIGKSTVHKWIAEGKLPQGKKLSYKCTVFDREEVEQAFADMGAES